MGETQLASYSSMVRYEVTQYDIQDKISHNERLIHPVCAQLYRVGNTLNHIATLKSAINLKMWKNLEIQMNIYVSANDKIGTN